MTLATRTLHSVHISEYTFVYAEINPGALGFIDKFSIVVLKLLASELLLITMMLSYTFAAGVAAKLP